MYTLRTYSPKSILQFTWIHLIWFTAWATAVVAAYDLLDFHYLKIPWIPMTLIGTAVAFYLGFKNNSAYGRTWEARKIWGAIVNDSRSWGMMTSDFITDEFATDPVTDPELHAIHERLIYRHIAWLYRLKRQLRTLRSWEHNQPLNIRFRAEFLNPLFPVEAEDKELAHFLASEEVDEMLSKQNPATQMLRRQSEELKHLKRRGLIDDFRHMEMVKMLTNFYTHQGKAERIKNFPLPRQYATVSLYFVVIFIFMLPMGLLSAFDGFGTGSLWILVPFSVLISWIFWMMEMVGDYAENPFENLAFDIPMDSLTRTIEIDLREMLGETELPPAITARQDILM